MKENKFLNVLSETAKFIILTIFGLIVFSLFVSSMITTCTMYDTPEIIVYEGDSLIKNVIALGAVIALGVGVRYTKLNKYINDKALLCASALVVACYLWFVLSTQLQLISDQWYCFTSATEFLNGDYYSWFPEGYAERYPNQNGLIVFFILVQLIFGKGNYVVVQLINLVGAVLSAVFMAKISELAFSLKNKRLTTMLMLMYAPAMLYITFTYGTILGLSLSVIGIYCQMKFITTKKWKYCIATAICLGLAVMLKSNYLIVLVASVLVYCFYAVTKKNWRCLVALAGVIGFYLAVSKGVTLFIETVTNAEVGKGVPTMAWITMGVSESGMAPGWYNGYNRKLYINSGFNSELAHEKAMSDFIERIEFFSQNPSYTVNFFGSKVLSMWCEPTFQSIWIQQVKGHPYEFPELVSSLLTYGEPLNTFYWSFFNILQTFVYFFSFTFIYFKYKKLEVYQLLPAIIIIGGFVFHLFWEGKGQYSMTYFYLLLPYAISGFFELTKYLNNKLIQKLRGISNENN